MLKIRLRRMGKKHRPFYRVVVSDSRDVPTAPAVEELGHYDPVQDPPEVRIDVDRIEHWVGQGAQMSPTVKKLVKGYEPPAEGASEAAPAASAKKQKDEKKAAEKKAAKADDAEAAPAADAEETAEAATDETATEQAEESDAADGDGEAAEATDDSAAEDAEEKA